MPQPKFYEIWSCILGSTDRGATSDFSKQAIVGSEQANTRPVIVMAIFNPQEIATIVPVTRGAESIASSSTVVSLGTVHLSSGRTLEGKALVHQIRSVSFSRLDEKLGVLSDMQIIHQLRNNLRKYLSLP